QSLRALTVVLDAGADRAIRPPDSNYPQPDQLVSLEEYSQAFPRIPGVRPPTVVNELAVLDSGPGLGAQGGVVTISPPRRGASYTLRVPRPNRDGLGVGGIDTIYTRVPLGSNLPWNLRSSVRAPDLCFWSGSFVPFA